jgi:Bacterial alpha-L-rhamnosidase.
MPENIKEELYFPIRIVSLEGTIENPDSLLRVKPMQIGLSEPDCAVVHGKASIVLDFGREIGGGARILTFLADFPCPIRLRFGESYGECCAEINERGACNDHALRDIKTELVNYSDMRFCDTGFRYLRVDFLGSGTVRLKSIVAQGTIYSAPAVYTYDGSDKKVADIFSAAKRTVDLCTKSGLIWDGVKRDRLVWIGDMYPEMRALTALYGRTQAVEDSLDFVIGQTPLPGWMNGMPCYSLWWIIICADYYAFTGCRDYMAKQVNYFEKLLQQIEPCVAENGELRFPGIFLDWPTHEQPDEEPGVRALAMLAMRKASYLAREFGLDSTIPETVLARLTKVEIKIASAKQALGLKFAATGSLNSDEVAMLIHGGARGMSTFMSWFILDAAAQTAGADVAVAMMKEYYGAMLERGATTFFEDFDMDWLSASGRIDEPTAPGKKDLHGDYGKYCYVGFRHSFCHGWSAGVIPFIQKYC